jgi:hypothetical protein
MNHTLALDIDDEEREECRNQTSLARKKTLTEKLQLISLRLATRVQITAPLIHSDVLVSDDEQSGRL